MIGGIELSEDERRIVDWLREEYESEGDLPTDPRHMIDVIRRCIIAGDHRK